MEFNQNKFCLLIIDSIIYVNNISKIEKVLKHRDHNKNANHIFIHQF